MTKYRPVFLYVTSGNASIKLKGEWVPYQDQAEEVIEETMKNENFIDSKVEMKHKV